jgi:protein disulfide-isomerase A6
VSFGPHAGCGHCQSLAPHWKKVAKNLQGLATVAAVNCDDKANAALCSRFNIRGYPTIK